MRFCAAPNCGTVVKKGYCVIHARADSPSTVTPPQIERYVVCGPPGIGKTTWVAQRARPGDIVWDLDKVADVVALIPSFPRPPLVLDALMEMQRALMQWLSHDARASAYVILTNEDEASRVAHQIRATLVRLTLENRSDGPAPTSRALRFCAAPHCKTLVQKGYCAAHRSLARRPAHPDYGTMKWRRYSQRRLARHPFCAACGLLAQVTDHIVPVTQAPDRFWDETNHRSLCQTCNAIAAHRPLASTLELDVDDGPVLA